MHPGIRHLHLKNAQDSLSSRKANTVSCLILDMNISGMTGLELQQEISGTNDGLGIGP
jgi:FixJ family two-component response regulator